MEQTATRSLSDLVENEVSAEYYRRLRSEFFGRGYTKDDVQALVEKVEGDAVKQACLWDLLGERKQALELLARSSTAWGLLLRGRMLLEEGRSADARDLLEKGVQVHEDCAELGPLLVEARVMTGDLEGGVQLLESVALPATHPHRDYLGGLIEERQGEYATALELYEKAAEECPEETRYQFRLGYLHALHGEEEKAIQAYEACQRTTPVYSRALINLGILYEDVGRYEDAMTCYDMVLQAYPDHERARMYVADAEASLDMYYDREKEKERTRHNQLLQLPVTDFELSVRSRNCLTKMNIHTLGDLIKKTEAELLSYKNFGETSLAEIKKILAQKGLRLGMGLEEERRKQTQQLPDSEHAKLLAQPVSVLELSSRSQRCMDRLGIESLGDLVKRTELELISQKNFGVTSLNEVKRKLKERSLSLASG